MSPKTPEYRRVETNDSVSVALGEVRRITRQRNWRFLKNETPKTGARFRYVFTRTP